MFKQIQIEEIRKLRIPNIVLSTKGRRRAWLEKRNTGLFSEDSG